MTERRIKLKFFKDFGDNELPENWQEQNRIMIALVNGRQMYDTGRTIGRQKHPVYETVNPHSRKLMGLKPLEEVITDKDNLKFIEYWNSNFDEKGSYIYG